MLQEPDLMSFVAMFSPFYVLPFLLAVVLPAWGIPTLVVRKLNRKKEQLPSIRPFIVSMAILAFLANLF